MNDNGAFQILDDYSWEKSRFIAAKDQYLQIELLEEMQYQHDPDEGYTVSRAERDHMFVDLHRESASYRRKKKIHAGRAA